MSFILSDIVDFFLETSLEHIGEFRVQLLSAIALVSGFYLIGYCCFSGRSRKRNHFYSIRDTYDDLDDVSDAIRAAGVEQLNLVVAVDCTRSNEWNGKESFNGRNLHDRREKNPYEQAIETIGRTLVRYDDDAEIPLYIFGDVMTENKRVSLLGNEPCHGTNGLIDRYNDLIDDVQLSGPTSFAPIVDEVCRLTVDSRGQYHVLVIVCDGQVDGMRNLEKTRASIAKASRLPVSIIIVGVGDGPFDEMENFDDGGNGRAFDNVQFVNFTEIMDGRAENKDVAFALEALQEIPEQYRIIKERYL